MYLIDCIDEYSIITLQVQLKVRWHTVPQPPCVEVLQLIREELWTTKS